VYHTHTQHAMTHTNPHKLLHVNINLNSVAELTAGTLGDL